MRPEDPLGAKGTFIKHIHKKNLIIKYFHLKIIADLELDLNFEWKKCDGYFRYKFKSNDGSCTIPADDLDNSGDDLAPGAVVIYTALETSLVPAQSLRLIS